MKNFIFSNPYATSIIKASLVQLKSMVTILLRTDHNFFLELIHWGWVDYVVKVLYDLKVLPWLICSRSHFKNEQVTQVSQKTFIWHPGGTICF